MKSVTKSVFPVEAIRNDFPILKRLVHKKNLVYFDNAATTQKPSEVIEALRHYYEFDNANIHRGVHYLSGALTEKYEAARNTIQKFIHAAAPEEIIFTKGTTDSINLLANSFGNTFIHPGDEILITEMEHHSNILPWQQLCETKQALLKVIPINENGELIQAEFDKLLSAKTKLLAITHVSNTLGTINPIKAMIAKAHAVGVPVMVDGAQSIPHISIDVQDLDCDFFCFSGHKLYAPTGVGVLYGKQKWLSQLAPYQVGGGTIKTVTFEKTTYAESPLKFEAGTPHIEGGIGLATAITYLNRIGMPDIADYEHQLLTYATQQIKTINQVRIIGTAQEKASVLSFVIDGIHPMDIGVLLDNQGIAVRTGHHCTQPLMQHYNIPGTIRVSFSFYNTTTEIDQFIAALAKSLKMLS